MSKYVGGLPYYREKPQSPIGAGIEAGIGAYNRQADVERQQNWAKRYSEASPVQKIQMLAEKDPALALKAEEIMAKQAKEARRADLGERIRNLGQEEDIAQPKQGPEASRRSYVDQAIIASNQNAGIPDVPFMKPGAQPPVQQNGMPQAGMPPQVPGQQNVPQVPQRTPEQLRQLAREISVDEPVIARNLLQEARDLEKAEQFEKAERAKEVKAKREEAIKFHQETQKFDEMLDKKDESAKSRIHAFGVMKKDLASGKLNPKNFSGLLNTAFKGTKWSGYFKNPEQARFESAALESFEGMKDMFGTRLSDADLEVVSGKVPSLDKSPEANLAVIEYNEFKDKMIREQRKIADEIKAENGGLRPLNFTAEIRKRMDERYGAEAEKVTRNALYEGKAGPKFDPSNPEHNQRRMQILEQVGGDRQKANELLAKEFVR